MHCKFEEVNFSKTNFPTGFSGLTFCLTLAKTFYLDVMSTTLQMFQILSLIVVEGKYCIKMLYVNRLSKWQILLTNVFEKLILYGTLKESTSRNYVKHLAIEFAPSIDSNI
jgi:hypothetical protein